MKIKIKSKFFTLLIVVLVLGVVIAGQVFAATNNDFELGTQNLNNTTQNSAKVGDQLLKPEKGWKRYDDFNKNIEYLGDKWKATENYTLYPIYKKTNHTVEYSPNEVMRFNFTGNKIRFLCFSGLGRAKDVKVLIDDIEYNMDTSSSNPLGAYLAFEKIGMENKEHKVKIISGSERYNLNCDAIDVDENGELKPYESVQENIKVTSLELNKNVTELLVGQDETLVATITPDNATNKSIKWTTSDSSIATVDQNGKVVGIKPGKVTITATAQDGSNLSKTCEVTVKEIDAGNGVLKIEMVTNDVYEYDVPVSEINKFIEWMKQKGSGDPFYKFSKAPTVGNIESRTEYLMYNQIVNFTVDKYK